MSGSLDSSVGLAAGIALAAALPDLQYACGLGTGRLLAADLVAATVLPEDGSFPRAPRPRSHRRCSPGAVRTAEARCAIRLPPADAAPRPGGSADLAPRARIDVLEGGRLNPSTAMARVIVDELVAGGVTEVVLAPGSRSAALAIALAEADERDDLRLHVRVDERSAGFLALGLAKVAREPVAVVTTSGTAVANLLPGAGRGLVRGRAGAGALRRPPAELRDTGAHQTIDQARFFGGPVRWAHEVAVAEQRVGQVRYWRSTSPAPSRWRPRSADSGPVHLNLAFREPLVPDGNETWIEPLGLAEPDSSPEERAAGGGRRAARDVGGPAARRDPRPVRRP